MKIAILGGSRFIGFHLARALAEHGSHQVTLFNRGRTPSPEPLPPSVNVVIGDRDVPAHAARLLDQPFDAICDLSGYSPRHVLPFLTPAHRSRIGHYVFCSTSSVYQVPPPNLYTETAPRTAAAGTYGGDKAAIEDILIAHWHRGRWPVTIVRPQGVFGPFDAQNIFDTLWPGALETEPLKIDITFYCKKCMGMATAKTCPHGAEHQVNISGTKQREMLSKGEPIPPEFSRPEVVAILREYYAGL